MCAMLGNRIMAEQQKSSKQMPIRSKTKWDNVRVSQGLLNMMDEFLKTERARRLDLHSKAGLASRAIRTLLKREQFSQPELAAGPARVFG
jgi:hypothetical protein